MRLQGKLAIVTGGSRDIGRDVCVQLAREGAKVVINYLNSEADAIETRNLIEKEEGQCIIVKGDMTKWEDAQKLVAESRKTFGEEVHILVNVAGGLFGRKPIEEQDEAWYDLVMDVNVKSVFLAT